jgi:hypothetical protein
VNKVGLKESLALLWILAAICCFGCRQKREAKTVNRDKMPPKILWAWERPEDLRFLDPEEFGVAFLAQTLTLKGPDVVRVQRRQPLEVNPEVYLIAVTRIETAKTAERRAELSTEQRNQTSIFVKKTLELPNVKAIQIDFDAAVSERGFYRELIADIRREIPEDTPLTMTALASWCIGDPWFSDLPVDEAVPMAFVMGSDSRRVRSFLAEGNDWREPLCRKSYGVSLEEPLGIDFKPGRRIFYFKSNAWDRSDIDRIK